MKSIEWKRAGIALLICTGVAACTGERADQDVNALGETSPATEQQPATDPGVTPADPYATAPPADSDPMTEPMTPDAQTIGETSGDRCAGLTGEAMTECLETERMRTAPEDELGTDTDLAPDDAELTPEDDTVAPDQ